MTDRDEPWNRARIADIQVDETTFELGRILRSGNGLPIELETMVPLKQCPVPFVRVHSEGSEDFEAGVESHPSVDRVRVIDRHTDETLYALDWDTSQDDFFTALETTGASLLSGGTSGGAWAFEIRFPSWDALSRFTTLCAGAHIAMTVDRIYSPTASEAEPWFGLTAPQRETLIRAVQGGYYDIPRQLSTVALAEEFGISDQAVTERLRRAIVGLVEHTVGVGEAGTDR